MCRLSMATRIVLMPPLPVLHVIKAARAWGKMEAIVQDKFASKCIRQFVHRPEAVCERLNPWHANGHRPVIRRTVAVPSLAIFSVERMITYQKLGVV